MKYSQAELSRFFIMICRNVTGCGAFGNPHPKRKRICKKKKRAKALFDPRCFYLPYLCGVRFLAYAALFIFYSYLVFNQ